VLDQVANILAVTAWKSITKIIVGFNNLEIGIEFKVDT
jgi:hypothetical protein